MSSHHRGRDSSFPISSLIILFRSLEGTVHELRSDMLVDGVALERFSDDEDENFKTSRDDDQHNGDSELLPGAGKGSKFDGSRNTAPEMLSTALGFSPTGREWAAATTQGLQIFSLDEAIHFAPTDLDITITPQSIRKAIREHEHTHALNMALHLAEKDMIKEALDSVAISSIPLVVKSIDLHMLKKLLRFLADEIVRLFFLASLTPYLCRLLLAILNTIFVGVGHCSQRTDNIFKELKLSITKKAFDL